MEIQVHQIKKEPLEDAYFICEEEGMFGVADGVGGWRREDIDPYKFSKGLMDNCKDLIENSSLRDLQKIISQAYVKVNDSGASTFCLIKIKNNLLTTLTLGDSSCIVLRNNKILFRTKETSHRFNYPFQLAKLNGKNYKDSPEDSIKEVLKLNEGDIILLSTDGLTDNLFDEEIIDELGKEDFVRVLNYKAMSNAKNKEKETPFSKKLNKVGGKPDDITTIGIFHS